MSLNENKILSLLLKPESKEKGFQILVKEYSKVLYFQIKKITKNHDDTNDVLQNTLIKAWRYIDGFKQDSKLSTWLYTIAKNESYTFIKKNKKYINSSSETIEIIFNNLKADTYLDSEEISKKLENAILSLPAKQKKVFQLRYFKEMKYAEMAVKLSVTESALKSSYHFAVKKIEIYLKTN